MMFKTIYDYFTGEDTEPQKASIICTTIFDHIQYSYYQPDSN